MTVPPIPISIANRRSAIVVGLIRTVKIIKMDFADITYSGIVVDLLTILELGVAIIVSSSTILRPVFDRIFHSTGSVAGSANKPQDWSRSCNQSRGQVLSDTMPLEDFRTDRANKAWTEGPPSEVEDGRRALYGREIAMADYSSEEKILGVHDMGYTTNCEASSRFHSST